MWVKRKDNFEELMSTWNPDSHRGSVKRLPIFAGGKYSERRVIGFTYVDEQVYNYWSRIMWVKAGRYVKSLLSERNMERLGLSKLEKGSQYILLHRAVLGISPACQLVGDHINGISLNNRKTNLRVCTKADNSRNSRSYKNKHGYKGVRYQERPNNPYLGQIRFGVRHESKAFKTIEQAARWYDMKAIEYFGEFAATNFPRDMYK